MSEQSKRNLLLIWWYDRTDLISPYLEMKDDFNITVLFYRFPEQENTQVAEHLPFRRIFWTDYLTADQMISDVQPDKIVVFGIESLLTQSILLYAKRNGIATFYVSHGLSLNLDERVAVVEQSISGQVDPRYDQNNPVYNRKKWHSMIFFLSSLSWIKPLTYMFLFKLMWSFVKRTNRFLRLKDLYPELWAPDKFLLYSTYHSVFFKQLLDISDDRFVYTGPYMMDKIFRDYHQAKDNSEKDTYWLFIDQPLLAVKEEDRLELIEKVGRVAMERNKKLFVKLHPLEFKKHFEEIPGVTFIREHNNIPELIHNCEKCLGFNSALLLAVIPFKQCYLFDHPKLNLIKEWSSTGAVKSVDFYQFTAADFNSQEISSRDESVNHFVNLYLMYTDGKCTERLKSALLQI